MRLFAASLALAVSTLIAAPRAEAVSTAVAPSLLSMLKTKIDRYAKKQSAKADYKSFLDKNPAIRDIQDAKFRSYGGGLTKAMTWFGRGSAILNIGVGLLAGNSMHTTFGLMMIPPSEVLGATTNAVRRVARTETLQFAKDKMRAGSVNDLTPKRLKLWQDAGYVGQLK